MVTPSFAKKLEGNAKWFIRLGSPMTLIDELLDLSTATRRVARTIADPSITPWLAKIASELDGMVRVRMSALVNSNVLAAPAVPVRQAEPIKDRRRPGRIHDVSTALIPLLRNPAAGLTAGDLAPLDSFQIIAAWAASAYPANVWLTMSATERSKAIDRELGALEAAQIAKATKPRQTSE